MDDPEIYMCGPPPMIDAMVELATERPRRSTRQQDLPRQVHDLGRRGRRRMEAASAPGMEGRDDEGTPRRRPRALVPVVHAEEAPRDDLRGRDGRHPALGAPPHRPRVAGPLRGRPRPVVGRLDRGCASADWYDVPRSRPDVGAHLLPGRAPSYEQLIEGAVRTARRERVFDDFTPEWVEFLRTNLQVPAFIEHGIWLALASAARDTPVGHGHALRRARGGDEAAPGAGVPALRHGPRGALRRVPGGARRARASCDDDAWQPARRYVERLRATPDWGERVFAANLCFEPIVGLLIRRELLMRSVRFNGDIVTQALSHVAQLEWEWVRGWTAELVTLRAARTPSTAPRTARCVGELAGRLAAARRGGGARARAGVRRAARRHLVRRRARQRADRRRRAAASECGVAELRRDRGRCGMSEETYDYVGIVMAKSEEGDAVADVLARAAGHRDHRATRRSGTSGPRTGS